MMGNQEYHVQSSHPKYVKMCQNMKEGGKMKNGRKLRKHVLFPCPFRASKVKN